MAGIGFNDSQILAVVNGDQTRLVRHYSIAELRQELSTVGREYFATPPSVSQQDWDTISRERDRLYQQFRASMGTSDDILSDVSGIGYDMGEYLAGTPECWYDLQYSDQPVYHVAVNPSSNYNRDVRTLVMRGAALCAIIDLLESRGARMSIEYCYGASMKRTDPGSRWHYRLVLKHPDQPLDLRRIADWIAGTVPASDWPRAYQHETDPTSHGIHVTDTVAAIHGHPYITNGYQFWASPELAGEFDIALDRVDNRWTEEFTRTWITEQIQALTAGTHAALAR